MIHLSTAYFPNIQYMSKFFLEKTIQIEAFENFQKQSYRNRTEILSANGKLSLFVPIVKSKSSKTAIRDVEIDYATDWQKQHFKSIESAYNSSPFYEYIIDDFSFVFDTQEKYLFDLNQKILEQILIYLQVEKSYKLSSDFFADLEHDFRNSIHPKLKMQKEDAHFHSNKYYQTFNDKFDFIENLSILDLLFNEGVQAISILKKATKVMF